MLLLASSLLIAACGGAADTTGTTGAGVDSTPAETDATSTSTSPEPSTGDTGDAPSATEDSATEDTVEQPPATAAVTDFEGPVAEDFSIDLNATGTFTLSEEARPVYLVFWAEW